MSEKTIEQRAARVAEKGTPVTVTRNDGKVFSGVLVALDHSPMLYKIQTGRRGRPAIVHVDEIEEIK